jgi:sporulation protein YlmC with PRC-barrel domain
VARHLRHRATTQDFKKSEELAMHGNIVSAVSQVLTPDMVARVASAAGISDRATAQTAVAAAVPAILSSLANLAAKPDGERRLADAMAKQSPRTLENLASASNGPAQLVDTGKSLLSSLLGVSSFTSLASAIGKFAGLGDGPVRSLLGMLAPVILGVLGRQAGAGANGLSQLLSSQRDDIAAAMPAGLSDVLRAGDRIGTVGAAAGRSPETYRPRQATGSAAPASASPASAPSSSWAYWALPFLALAGFAWYFWGNEQSSQPVTVAPPPPTVQRSTAGTDLQPQVAAAIDSLSRTLQGVKDRPSAPDALPKLQQAAGELDRLSALAGRLPFEARDRLAESIKTTTAQLKATLDSVNTVPGLPPDAKPVIASLRTKLDALAMTPLSVAQQRTAALGDRAAYLARPPADAVSLSAYFDRHVYNGAGERIGTVSDLIVGPDARITAAVIGVGSFLGIGEKEVAVPFAAVQIVRRDNDWHLVIEGTRDALNNAPAYEDTAGRVRLGPAPDATRK